MLSILKQVYKFQNCKSIKRFFGSNTLCIFQSSDNAGQFNTSYLVGCCEMFSIKLRPQIMLFHYVNQYGILEQGSICPILSIHWILADGSCYIYFLLFLSCSFLLLLSSLMVLSLLIKSTFCEGNTSVFARVCFSNCY